MKEEMVKTINLELKQRKNYIRGESIETIYFGGGTPSLLTLVEIEMLLDGIMNNYTMDENPEITLEANPDDLYPEYLHQLHKLGINRLSVGIQSFHDDELRFLKRRHSASQALESIEGAKREGFDNISIDLIYAIPDSSTERWQKNLVKAFKLGVQHLSAYMLTIEPKTVLAQIMRTNRIEEIGEEECLKQFQMLIEMTFHQGLIQYEISNFGKESFFSRHNSNYWKNKMYIGVGPSAHSYNLDSRQWNVANNKEYMEKVKRKDQYFFTEILNVKDKYNEYILTSLRTMWGVDLDYIRKNFGGDCEEFFLKEAEKKLKSGLLEIVKRSFRITHKGKFITDAIIKGFMRV